MGLEPSIAAAEILGRVPGIGPGRIAAVAPRGPESKRVRPARAPGDRRRSPAPGPRRPAGRARDRGGPAAHRSWSVATRRGGPGAASSSITRSNRAPSESAPPPAERMARSRSRSIRSSRRRPLRAWGSRVARDTTAPVGARLRPDCPENPDRFEGLPDLVGEGDAVRQVGLGQRHLAHPLGGLQQVRWGQLVHLAGGVDHLGSDPTVAPEGDGQDGDRCRNVGAVDGPTRRPAQCG